MWFEWSIFPTPLEEHHYTLKSAGVIVHEDVVSDGTWRDPARLKPPAPGL